MIGINYPKLRGRIVEKYGTVKDLASKIGLSETTLYLKINGVREFNYKDITKMITALEIDPKEAYLYFFYSNTYENVID